MIYKKSNSIVYKFVVNCQVFLNNSVKVYPMKLNIGMLDHMSNTFQNTFFKISVDVPLKYAFK